jgi:sigma-B regulation protein RsbU (phosphoserine phosphatase)
MSSVSSGYRKTIDAFKDGRLTEREIEKRLSDLVLLADFSGSLNGISEAEEIADLLLLTLMGATTSRRAVFLLWDSGCYRLLAVHGYRSRSLPTAIDGCLPESSSESYYVCNTKPSLDLEPLFSRLDLRLFLPVRQDGKLLGLAGLGDRTDRRSESEHDLDMLTSLAQMTAAALQHALIRQEMNQVNRQLSLKVHQLNTLFELSKDFYSLWEADEVFHILGSTLIGQLVVARCAVLVFSGEGLVSRFIKGVRLAAQSVDLLNRPDIRDAIAGAPGPLSCEDPMPEELRELLEQHRIAVLFPLRFSEQLKGMILLGNKVNRRPFTRDERDLVVTLTNLALASEESIRMQRQMLEKQRMEKELALAREIQMSLLPSTTPEIPGYELDSVFRPCYQVGGDYFDFLPVSDQELAVAIGDVSGKSIPAAMIMASVQASLRTVVSMHETDPRPAIERINQILCDRQSRKYVTFVYGILNFQTHDLAYVNAGHCYPVIIRKGGAVENMDTGGLVIGFFKDATYQTGHVHLEPGDLIILYTDGVSELLDPQEQEFGAEGITKTLLNHRHKPVALIKEALIEAIDRHRQNLEPGDDITFLLVKRSL